MSGELFCRSWDPNIANTVCFARNALHHGLACVIYATALNTCLEVFVRILHCLVPFDSNGLGKYFTSKTQKWKSSCGQKLKQLWATKAIHVTRTAIPFLRRKTLWILPACTAFWWYQSEVLPQQWRQLLQGMHGQLSSKFAVHYSWKDPILSQHSLCCFQAIPQLKRPSWQHASYYTIRLWIAYLGFYKQVVTIWSDS